MAQQRKKKRRREPAQKKKKGVMIGMRSGFKKAARGVGVGAEGEKAAEEKKKTRSWLSTAFTILLVLAAIAVLYYRNR
jgi:hypothetical protein